MPTLKQILVWKKLLCSNTIVILRYFFSDKSMHEIARIIKDFFPTLLVIMIFFVPCQNSKLINVISKWKLLSKLVFEQYAKNISKKSVTLWWSKIKQHAQL